MAKVRKKMSFRLAAVKGFAGCETRPPITWAGGWGGSTAMEAPVGLGALWDGRGFPSRKRECGLSKATEDWDERAKRKRKMGRGKKKKKKTSRTSAEG